MQRPTQKKDPNRLAAAEEAWQQAERKYWAAAVSKGKSQDTKGKGGKPKGKVKGLVGYGECYNCGE